MSSSTNTDTLAYLSAENARLHTALLDKTKSLSTLSIKCSQYQSLIQTTESDMASLLTKIDTYTTKSSETKRALSEATKRAQTYELENTRLKEQLVQVSTQRDTYLSQINNLSTERSTQIDKFTTEIEKLLLGKQTLESVAKSKLQHVFIEYAKLRKLFQLKVKEMEDKEAFVRGLESQVHAMQYELRDALDKIEELAPLRQQIELITLERDTLKQQLQTQTTQYETSSQKTTQQLHSQMELAKKLFVERIALLKQVNDARDKLSAYETKRLSSESKAVQVDNLVPVLKSLETHLEKVSKEEAQLHREYESLEQYVREIFKQGQEKDRVINELRAALKSLQDRVSIAQSPDLKMGFWENSTTSPLRMEALAMNEKDDVGNDTIHFIDKERQLNGEVLDTFNERIKNLERAFESSILNVSKGVGSVSGNINVNETVS